MVGANISPRYKNFSAFCTWADVSGGDVHGSPVRGPGGTIEDKTSSIITSKYYYTYI